ncbi:MAG: hypothetical protein B5M55_07385, partial [Desulfococcus sp. 4484_242]
KSLKRPARRPGAEEKFFCPGTRFAVIPLIIEVIQSKFIVRIPDCFTPGCLTDTEEKRCSR